MAKVSINIVKIRIQQAQEDLEDAEYLFKRDSFKGANFS